MAGILRIGCENKVSVGDRFVRFLLNRLLLSNGNGKPFGVSSDEETRPPVFFLKQRRLFKRGLQIRLYLRIVNPLIKIG